MAHQLSSAQQRTAAQEWQRNAVRCRAMPYCAVLCRAVPWYVLCCTYSFVQCQVSFELSYRVPVLLHHVCTYIVEAQKMHTQFSAQPSYSSVAQRSTVRCRAVPCFVLRCGAVPRCAVLSFEHAAVPGIVRSTRYPRMYSSFSFLHFNVLSWSCFFSPTTPLTVDQNVNRPTSTQHSTGQSALPKYLLAIPNRSLHQIMSLYFCPLHI